ncbi:MAG: DUF454 family protein [Nitrospirae bacterium]|nr:DUF454 family protein [Nitrospirota bacterium]
MNNITNTGLEPDGYACPPEGSLTTVGMEVYIPFEVKHSISGRLRVVSEALVANKPLSGAVNTIILALPGIRETSLNNCCGSMTIYYDEQVIGETDILKSMNAIAMNIVVTIGTHSISLEKSTFVQVNENTRPNRLYEIVGVLLAGLGIITLILPGIPGIPILMLSAYFLAKSSGPLYNRLLNNNYIGKYLKQPQRLAITDNREQ